VTENVIDLFSGKPVEQLEEEDSAWLVNLKESDDWASIAEDVAFVDVTEDPVAAREAIVRLRVLVLGIHDGPRHDDESWRPAE
jgi:hypothetical protein